METNERILTEKQQAVWDLKEQGLTRKAIAEQLGITVSAVREHIKNAERRFTEYERFKRAEAKNKEIITVDLMRCELKIIAEALREYEFVLMKQASFRVNSDWRGRLPYGAEQLPALSEKIQTIVYGEVIHEGLLAQCLQHPTDEEEQIQYSE